MQSEFNINNDQKINSENNNLKNINQDELLLRNKEIINSLIFENLHRKAF